MLRLNTQANANTAAMTRALAQQKPPTAEDLTTLKGLNLRLSADIITIRNMMLKEESRLSSTKKNIISAILTEQAAIYEELSKLNVVDEFERQGLELLESDRTLKQTRVALNDFISRHKIAQMDADQRSTFSISLDYDEFIKLGAAFQQAWEKFTEHFDNKDVLLGAMRASNAAISVAYPLRKRLEKLKADVQKFEESEKDKSIKELYIRGAKHLVEKELPNDRNQGKQTINIYTLDDKNPKPYYLKLCQDIPELLENYQRNLASDTKMIKQYKFFLELAAKVLAHYQEEFNQSPPDFFADPKMFSKAFLALVKSVVLKPTTPPAPAGGLRISPTKS